MKKMPKSKNFMRDNKFEFAQIMNKKEPKPLNDLLLQLGLNPETQNVFHKAKEHKFTTFFSGPKLIRDLIEPDFDTTDHQNFIQQFLVDERSCLKDGRNLLSDQLEKMSAFLTSTSDSKIFSTLFLDDYGPHKSSIDHELSEMLNSLNHSKIFENTSLIVTSYGLSEKDVQTDNEKNPLFAVRLSDKFMKNYQEKHYFMKMNFNRLLSSLNFNSMLIELIGPNTVITTTPFKVQPTWRNCASEGISATSCVCMNMNLKSDYPEESEKNFLNQLRARFAKEVKSKKCVRSFGIEDYSFFYDYALNTKKELRGVELTGFANITGFSGEKTLMLKKMFTFKKDFESFQSFDTARVIVAYEVNIGIARIRFLPNCLKLSNNKGHHPKDRHKNCKNKDYDYEPGMHGRRQQTFLFGKQTTDYRQQTKFSHGQQTRITDNQKRPDNGQRITDCKCPASNNPTTSRRITAEG
ncbi:hypothetical protein B9Z55_019344 [Caenorhabditis nigoni]|nr:hypothetical protein B9Z55_019344 [Caenorhabditis nigoni]